MIATTLPPPVPVESHPLGHVDDYLEIGQKADASDVHLGVAAPPIWRVHGTLEPMWPDAPPLTREETVALADAFMPELYKEELNARGDSDFAYANKFARYRVSVVRQRLGIEIVFRVINTHVRTMNELGLPEHLKLLTRYQNGLILATGSVGTGKSTTLAAMIEQINMDAAIISSRSRTRSNTSSNREIVMLASAKSSRIPSPSPRRCAPLSGKTQM
jgi:twitching motility protein PilT